MQWRFKHSHGGDHSPVSTFAVLLLVALVAAGCVLWFMTVAMRNERLAVQQRLSDVYLNHLATVERELTTFWRERQMAVQSFTGNSASEIFAATIRSNLADSVILYDPSGTVAYPSAPNAKPGAPAEEPKGWEAARELEFQKTNYVAAAEAYRRLAKSNADIHLKARGMQAQGSCLLKAGLEKPALEVLAALTNDSELRNAISPQGLLLVPNAQLLVLKVTHDSSDPQFQQTLADLTRRLNDYSESEFSAGQRRFLMEEVNSLKSLPVEAQDSGRLNSGTAPRFPTLVAEALAAEYLELQPVFPAEFKLLRGIGIKVWRLATADRLKVVLFREDRVREEMNAFLAPLSLPEIRVALFAPGDVLPSNQPLPAQEAGELFPGWRLALQFQGVDPFLAASERQTRFHLWTGSLVVLIIAALAYLAARFVGAQMRLARVKNELVSTVSHELKTPLASMGVLVDTLLAGRYHGSEQLQKYLRLLAKENRRLSHLIENFLSFSRMERNKQPFRMENVAVSRIVEDAVNSLQDRLNGPNCRLEIQIAPDLPEIRGDREALTMVLINLLENAWKYTGEEKLILIKAHARNGSVMLEVRDNGIGIERLQAGKVFDRFHQADQSLTRKSTGCGLGLSIVQFIVKGHGGSVEVASEIGSGSTFTVRLPVREGIAG